MGRDLSGGKITASHLDEEINARFEILIVSNFLVPRNGPVRYQKADKHLYGLYFGPLNPPACVAEAEDIFFASKNHVEKNKFNVEDAGKFFLLSPTV